MANGHSGNALINATGPDKSNPSNTTSSYKSMESYWMLVRTLMGGVEAMRRAGQKYLPKFQGETKEDYDARRTKARFTNIFGDMLANLAMKPFMEDVSLSEETSQEFKEFSKDVTGCKDTLHVFASQIFHNALRDGITWVLVDYSKDNPMGLTLAEERNAGVRPYWAEYEALDVIAVHSKFIKGVETLTHVRLREAETIRDEFSERIEERIRVLRHDGETNPTWELWVKIEDEWMLKTPPTEMTISRIPLVPLVLGKRRGKSWMLNPPMRDAAELQVELYQQENGLKNARELTAFPMLAANGIEPETGEDQRPKELTVGPNAVLYGGISESGGGSWGYVEPHGQSLTFLREDIQDTIRELRELGKQPLTPQSENLTVITTAFAAMKGSTAIMSWIGLTDKALENMFMLTGEWLDVNDPMVNVKIYQDFDLGFGDDKSFDQVMELGTGDRPMISRSAVINEAKRRGILAPNYDAETDLAMIELVDDEEDPMMP